METTKAETCDNAFRPLRSSPAGISNGIRKKNGSLSNQTRLETPIGTRPAAKVIRSSRCDATISKTAPVATCAGDYHTDPADVDDSRDNVNGMPPDPVVGNIMERSRRRRIGKKVNVDKNMSVQDSNVTRNSGFPSLKMPIGTFASKNATHLRSERSVQEVATTHLNSDAQSSTKPIDGRRVESLQEAITRDSQSILAQMPEEEIMENVKELHETLSPEMIKFLKGRKHDKKSSAKTNGSEIPDNNVVEYNTMDTKNVNITGSDDKERFARILSEIKSLDDLDKAYATEMDRQGLSFLSESSQVNGDEFETAFDLLRSTSSRQRMWAVKAINQKLKQELDSGCRYPLDCKDKKSTKWPYPLVLTVSLRCLLDEPIAKINHGILHSCALQSLYTLILMRAPMEEVINVRFDSEECIENRLECFSTAFQHCCLDDFIPKQCCHEAISSTEPLNEVGNSVEMYSASSSSVTAGRDGINFCRGPIWTLFTDMKLLPRLTGLLRVSSNAYATQMLFTPATVEAICGILSMIGERSPGAASAIVMHPCLLRDLSRVSLTKKPGSCVFDHSMAGPFVILLQTLARQSRLAAENLQHICEDSIFSQAFVEIANSYACYRLQQEVLILWRTFLRYGLSLSTIPTMLMLAAPHLTLGKGSQSTSIEFTLSAEFFSCLTVIINCITALPQTIPKQSTAVNDNSAVLLEASAWISSSKRLALTHLKKSVQGSAMNVYTLKHWSSILSFVNTMLKATATLEGDRDKLNDWSFSLSEEEECADVLIIMLENADFQFILRSVCSGETLVEMKNQQALSVSSLTMEASFYTFAESLVALVTSLAMRNRVRGSAQHQIHSTIETLNAKFKERLDASLNFSNSNCRWNKPYHGRPRCNWINKAHFAVCAYVSEHGNLNSKILIRGLGLALIGRLELGEEIIAACLFNFDFLFHDGSANVSLKSPLQEMLSRELCRSPASQKQLDHSYLLHPTYGMNTSGYGPFHLDSLRCDGDLGLTGVSRTEFLPLGRLWPWKIIMGSLYLSESARGIDLQSPGSNAILLSAFRMISELEDHNDGFASSLSTGGKLYYLMNASLLPESILANEEIQKAINPLFDLYFDQMDFLCIREFVEECVQSSPKLTSKTSKDAADADKVNAILNSETYSESVYSDHEVRVLLSFVGDLCDAFLESGSQSVFFAKCVRTFIMKGFPTKIRCEVLGRLRDVIHLLSLEEDGDCVLPLTKLLSGGDVSTEWSIRDSTGLLEVLSSLFAAGTVVRFDAKLILAFSVATLARSIAMAVCESSGLSVSKRRVMSLDDSIARAVVKTVSIFFSAPRSLISLVKATCEVCGSLHYSDAMSTTFDNEEWSLAISVASAIQQQGTKSCDNESK